MTNTQFDPRWYLMHYTDPGQYIGPFDTEDQAKMYRLVRHVSKFAVVRTSKPRASMSPREYDALWGHPEPPPPEPVPYPGWPAMTEPPLKKHGDPMR